MDIANADIAALSMDMSQAKVQQQAGIAVAKKTMDVAEEIASQLISSLAEVMPPSDMGRHIDVNL